MEKARLPTISSFVIMRLVAAVSAFVLIVAGGICGSLFFLTITTTTDVPGHLAFLLTPWWQTTARLYLGVLTPVCLIGGLILLLMRPLFYMPLHALTHDTMLRDIEAMLPGAINSVLGNTYAEYAKILWFQRLVSDLKREAPKLRHETSEYIALLALTIADHIGPLVAETTALTQLVSDREREAVAAEDAVTHTRAHLATLGQRVRHITSGRSIHTAQINDLLRELDDLKRALLPYLPDNVVNMTRPAE